MVKVFEKNLVLEKDITFNESIEVNGSIIGENGNRYNLTVQGNIKAWNINAENIDARNINAEDINAEDINAENINAENIDARNINAEDIKAENINAWNINAEDIFYYAVCFAYSNISCNSIKGKRQNSKHFCLDGKITIRDKEEVCQTCEKPKEESE